MGIMSWDLDGGFNTAPLVRAPRLTIRYEYPDMSQTNSAISSCTDSGQTQSPSCSVQPASLFVLAEGLVR